MKNIIFIVLLFVCYKGIAMEYGVDESYKSSQQELLQEKQQINIIPYPRYIKLESEQPKWLHTQATLKIAFNDNDHVKIFENSVILKLFNLAFANKKALYTKDINEANIVITLKQSEAAKLQNYEDESYQIDINEKQIKITATNNLGLIYSLNTLIQVIQNNNNESTAYKMLIDDAPKFTWRGLLLDSARHYLDIDTIKRELDLMSFAKLNVFHWHLTDDQAWRFQSQAYPKLASANDDGLFYTKQQMLEVVQYAKNLGIRVVPEIDFPGHASAIAVSYPEFTSKDTTYNTQLHWGVFKPLLDPTNPKVYAFIDKIIEEASEIFPDRYVHIGGDEVDPEHWLTNENIKSFMQQNNLDQAIDLHNYFNKQILNILGKYNKTMIGWDEVFNDKLPKQILVQSWRGQDSLNEIAQKGYKGILSTGFYYDQPQYAFYHHRNKLIREKAANLQENDTAKSFAFTIERLKGSAINGSFTLMNDSTGDYVGFIDFANRARMDLRDIEFNKDFLGREQVKFNVDTWMGPVYFHVLLNNNEILADSGVIIGNYPYKTTFKKAVNVAQHTQQTQISKAESQNIIGGEIALWSENVDNANIDVKLWPRAFVASERFWSDEKIDDVDSLYVRLSAIDNILTNKFYARQYLQGIQNIKHKLKQEPQDSKKILTFLEMFEPAHYYTRNHLKFLAGNYHQLERLNRVADVIPAENLQMHKIGEIIKNIINKNHNSNNNDVDFVNEKIKLYDDAIKYINSNSTDAELSEIANITQMSLEKFKKVFSLFAANNKVNLYVFADDFYGFMNSIKSSEAKHELVFILNKYTKQMLESLQNN